MSDLVFDETGNGSGLDSSDILIVFAFALKVFVRFTASDAMLGSNGVAMGGSFTWVWMLSFIWVLLRVVFLFFLILVTGRGGRFVVLFLVGVAVTVVVTVE